MSRKTFRCRLNSSVTEYNRDYVLQNLLYRFSGYNPEISAPEGAAFTLSVDTDEHLTASVIREKLAGTQLVDSISSGESKKRVVKIPKMAEAKKFKEHKDLPEHASLMVKAKDTGRILFIQTRVDKKSPNKGKWELPGGHVEEGESFLECAIREWEEEVGCKLPKGKLKDYWQNGRYRTYLYVIKHEDKVKINPTKKTEDLENPDNPKRSPMDVVAWWDPDDIEHQTYLREDIFQTNWNKVRKASGEDWAHGKGINGTPLTDTASNNPFTTQQGDSGVTSKGITGEDQRSYTIGDIFLPRNGEQDE